jgi:hypothetical protein
MTTVVARIHRVLQGHSPTAMLQASTDTGHEIKLEVPLESIRGVTPGQVLVLQWSVHNISEMVVGEVIPPVSRPAEEPTPSNAPPPAAAAPPSSETQVLESMLGLAPGRLQFL